MAVVVLATLCGEKRARIVAACCWMDWWHIYRLGLVAVLV
uniref:Uncharacterized protein n=1 Tax=Arundo donax TaxID=35708 RepID=A0A0A8YE71_ARUDO